MCDMLGFPGRECVVEYAHSAVKGATYLLDWLRIDTLKPFVLKTANGQDQIGSPAQWAGRFGLVVAVGSASYYPAKVCAKKAGLPVVALMYPRGFRGDFDRILCPFYDNPPRRESIATLPVTLCSKDKAFYQAMTEDFGRQYAYSLPAVGVIIGGDNKYERMCPDRIREQLEQLFALTPNHQHWVTTSRRTDRAVEQVVERFDFDYRLIYSQRQYNPIPAFLMLCEYLFVTSDSASMISESVCTGRSKVEILRNVTHKKSKFDRFLDGLEQADCIHIFDGQLGRADKKVAIEQDVKDALAPVLSGPLRAGGGQ